MWCTILEGTVIGLLTFIVGYIIFNITNKNDNKKSYNVYITFFMTGFLLHIILEIYGFNKWYCDKKDKCYMLSV
jgi:hypothetical protein